MDLVECRNQIDQIDGELLKLFEKRMQIVSQVAAYKKEHQLPILNQQREDAVIEEKSALAQPQMQEYVKSFFTTLMEISKCYQQNLLVPCHEILFSEQNIQNCSGQPVGCAGTLGAYAHIASRQLFPSSEIHFYKSFNEVFEAVKNNQVLYGVVPIENSSAGSVGEVYDLLKQYDLSVNLTYRLQVRHCLAARSNLKTDSLKGIYSHKQALGQCSEFLKSHAEIPVHPYLNTALAAKFVAESDLQEKLAAICSEECAEIHGLQILKTDLQNISDNYTKFIVISRQLTSSPQCNEISICVRIPNQSGELNKMLTKFSLYGIDMTKLESRPIGDKDFSVLFYINFFGNLTDRNVQELISDLSHHCEFLKLLGAYYNRE